MRYIYASLGGLYAFIIFIILVYMLPGKGSSNDVEIILTISTFLFAIIAGFYISRLNTRYEKLKELIASEDSYWLSLYRTSQIFGKKFRNNVKEVIDSYYISWFDWEFDYYKPTHKYIDLIFQEINKMKKPKKDNSDNIYSRLVIFLTNIEEKRNHSSVLALSKLTRGQWITLYSLASIILFCIFYLKTPSIYSQFITVLLSTVLVLVLLTIRDLQNLMLDGNYIADESGQEVLEYIGKLRYYSKNYVDNGFVKIPPHIKKYRIGLHKPGEKHNIKIVKN